jgi:DNA-binding NarL/FixJ family response regulator
MTKLLIVDDHADFRGLARSLLTAAGFEVTGEVGDGESVLAAVLEQRPDVVLLDVNLPGIDGFEVARRVAAVENAPRVVLTSSRDRSDYGTRIDSSPIRGFIPKHEISGDAVTALLSAA